MLPELPDYPWEAMTPFVERAKQHPGGMIDLSIGSPIDPTPEIVQDALAAATDAHRYPHTIGTSKLRAAIVAWFERRRGARGLTPANVLPTIGSKEFVAWLPLMLRLGEGDVVVHPRAAYPTYAIGALIANATPFASDDPAEWPAETKLVWLNSPGNPDGRVLSEKELKARVDRARQLGAVVASDECYAELGWQGQWAKKPTPSVLSKAVVGSNFDGILCAYSLSKQSNMAGYRSAFVAGDAKLIDQLANVRKHAGMIVPAPVQSAMIVALGNDSQVVEQKERYRRRRELLIPALEKAGYRIDHSEAGLYLWITEGLDCWESIGKLADLGIIGGPGVFYGDYYPTHVRLSLTETDEKIEQAAQRLSELG